MTIRVFGKESIFQRQYSQAVNKLILCEITREFCGQWHEVRMFYVNKMFQIFGICLVIMQKGYTDTVTLILLQDYTTNIWWIQAFIESYESMNRNLLSA